MSPQEMYNELVNSEEFNVLNSEIGAATVEMNQARCRVDNALASMKDLYRNLTITGIEEVRNTNIPCPTKM